MVNSRLLQQRPLYLLSPSSLPRGSQRGCCHLQVPYNPTPPLHTVPTPQLACPPIPPEEPITAHYGTTLTGLIPPHFAYASDVVALGLDQSFLLLLVIPHAAHISIERFQMCSSVLSRSWSRVKDLASTPSLKHWCAAPGLMCSEPGFILFPFKSSLKLFQ